MQFLDLRPGRYDNLVYNAGFHNTAKGNGFFVWQPNPLSLSGHPRIPSRNQFAVHFQPILLLLIPIYAVLPSIYTLLGISVIGLGLAAIPLFKLCKNMFDEQVAMVFTLSYLANPTVLFNTYAFHGIVFAPLFGFGLLWAYQNEQSQWFLLFLIGMLSLKENVAILIIPLSIYFILDSKYTKHLSDKPRRAISWNLPAVLLALAWFIASFKLIIPSFSSGASDYVHATHYQYLGQSMTEIVVTLILEPWRAIPEILSLNVVRYIIQLLAMTGFIAIGAPEVLLVGVFVVTQNILATTPLKISLVYQNTLLMLPALYVAMIIGYTRLSERYAHQRYRIFASILITVGLLAIMSFHQPFYDLRLLLNHLGI